LAFRSVGRFAVRHQPALLAFLFAQNDKNLAGELAAVLKEAKVRFCFAALLCLLRCCVRVVRP
jgi:hypothetical protein